MLSLLVARSVAGSTTEDSIRFAVASELLHNATLLHDDVADESDRRRGCPTLRCTMGPSVSVLVGDFWLVRAVRAVLDADRARERVVSMYAKTLSDLAEGEMFQLQKASTGDTMLEDYLSIIYRKTASLFEVTALTAAISVGASAQMEEAAAAFGRNVGLAFQMQDDIFDYLPSAALGKPCGVDLMEGKITLPLLGALRNVPREQQERIRGLVRGITPDRRDEIAAFVREHGGIEYARDVLHEYVDKALQALEDFPPSKDRDILSSLSSYIATRDK